MERNIVAELEKRIGEALKTSLTATPLTPVAAHPADPGALCRKIEELERRLSDFSQAASLSTSQLKNIEESKASARREIEDLLKAVREQQKYSEMDRQMHDQLEKSWARVAELEKKLMEFYSSVLAMETKRREDSSASAERSAKAIEALSERLSGLEEKISVLAARPETGKEAMKRLREQEALTTEKAAELGKLVRAIMLKAEEMEAALEASSRRRVAELEKFLSRADGERRAAAEEAMRSLREQASVLSAEKAAELGKLADGVMLKAEEMEAALEASSRRRVAELEKFLSKAGEERRVAAEEAMRLLREQAALLSVEKASEFRKAADAGMLKAEEAANDSARRRSLELEELSRRLHADLGNKAADYAATAKKENDERFEKFGSEYADALVSVTFMEGFRADLNCALDRLESAQAQMRDLLKDVHPEHLEKLMGVSGMLVRRKFDTMASALETLGLEGRRLCDIKRGIEERFRNIFGSR